MNTDWLNLRDNDIQTKSARYNKILKQTGSDISEIQVCKQQVVGFKFLLYLKMTVFKFFRESEFP